MGRQRAAGGSCQEGFGRWRISCPGRVAGSSDAAPHVCSALCPSVPTQVGPVLLSPLSLDQLSFHSSRCLGLDSKYDSHAVCIHLKVSQGQSPVLWGWLPEGCACGGGSPCGLWARWGCLSAIGCQQFPRTHGLHLCSAAPCAFLSLCGPPHLSLGSPTPHPPPAPP